MESQKGLGDLVAIAFASVGITQDRAQLAAAYVGMADCGCGQRREHLNAIGRRIGIGTGPLNDSASPAQ